MDFAKKISGEKPVMNSNLSGYTVRRRIFELLVVLLLLVFVLPLTASAQKEVTSEVFRYRDREKMAGNYE